MTEPNHNPTTPEHTKTDSVNRVKRAALDYLSHLQLFSRNARLYLIGSFLMGINSHVFNLLLNLYLREQGFLEGDIGLVVSARAVGMSAIAIPVAILLSKVRLKPILLGSSILFALFSFFLSTAQELYLLISFACLAGMAFSFFRVASAPFYMRNSTSQERTHLFSFSFGVMLLSGMVGSIGSGKLVTIIGDRTGDIITGYQWTLFLGIGLGLLSLIPFFLIKSAAPSSEENSISWSRQQFKARGGFYAKISSINFMIGLGAGLIIPFLNLYFRDRFNLGPDMIGLYYFVVQFSMLAGTLSGPVLVRRFGLVRTVVMTQLLSIPFMLILSYSYFLPLAVLAFIVRGGLMNLGVPILTNLGMELSQKKEQGLVNALLQVGWTSGWMISSAVGGSLIQKQGYTFTMNVTIVIYIVASLAFFRFFGKAETRQTGVPGWRLAQES